MKRLVMAVVASIAMLLASSCATVAPDRQGTETMSDAQRLEQNDDYVPWQRGTIPLRSKSTIWVVPAGITPSRAWLTG